MGREEPDPDAGNSGNQEQPSRVSMEKEDATKVEAAHSAADSELGLARDPDLHTLLPASCAAAGVHTVRANRARCRPLSAGLLENNNMDATTLPLARQMVCLPTLA